MNFVRFGYYLMLATFAPARLQAIADRAYEHERNVAESVVGTLWLLGIDPSPYIELRSAEICSLCNRETFIWFHHDRQCAICMREWLDEGFNERTFFLGRIFRRERTPLRIPVRD